VYKRNPKNLSRRETQRKNDEEIQGIVVSRRLD
jgi:hypothetical protein